MIHELLNIVLIVVAVGLTLLTLPGTVELCLLTMGSLLPRRSFSTKNPTFNLRIAVVIPAHNEEQHIARCVRSVLRNTTGLMGFSVVVVADNCTDDTATRAVIAGARVLIRADNVNRGKGFALDFAFKRLIVEGFDAFIVIDADSEIDASLVSTFALMFSNGADAIQCRYLVNNPDSSIRTRLMNVALLAFNALRPLGRSRLGLSCGILGNGFGLTRETLLAVPYEAGSVVEDLEYHLKLVKTERLVSFADTTTVRGDMPVGGKGVKTQRARWEGGRLQMALKFVPALCRQVLKGNSASVEPLLDLLLLPLAFHVALLLLTFAFPFPPTRFYAGMGLMIVAFHILGATVVGGRFKDVAVLALAPFYILWKLAQIPAVLLNARKQTEWVRTERTDLKSVKNATSNMSED